MRKLWRNRPLLIGILAVVLFFVLAGLTMGSRTEEDGWDLFASAVMPVQNFARGITEDVTAFFVRVFNPSVLEEETQRENARLTELMDFADSNTGMYYVTAKVIAKSSNPYVGTLTLNVGTRSGVAEKMAVVVANGVVGRVTEVGATWCKVRTLQNDDMRLSVMVERTRDEGMLGGLIQNDGVTDGLQLYYLPANASLEAGDRILTSGLGGVFPRGLYVGRVLYLPGESAAFDACVETEVDFSHLEEVLVILGMDGVTDG